MAYRSYIRGLIGRKEDVMSV